MDNRQAWVAVAKAEGRIYLLEGKGRMAMHDIVRMEYTKLHSRLSIKKAFRRQAPHHTLLH